jgi:predicted GNAT family N-acyltransferase
MNFTIVHYQSQEYYRMVELRDTVLRKPLGLTLDLTLLGNEETSIHIAGFEGNTLQCCLLLTPIEPSILQMRQVAVDTRIQSKGIGKQLVQFSENIARELFYKEIILHARKNVVGFYEKMGYSTYGDEYIEVSIPHINMKKIL